MVLQLVINVSVWLSTLSLKERERVTEEADLTLACGGCEFDSRPTAKGENIWTPLIQMLRFMVKGTFRKFVYSHSS